MTLQVVIYEHCGLCFAGETNDRAGMGGANQVMLHNVERRSWLQPWRAAEQGLRGPVCSMQLPPQCCVRAGPRIRLNLPSFSGGTPECPQLLQYTCQLATNVRAVPAAKIKVMACPLLPNDALTVSILDGYIIEDDIPHAYE